MNVDIVNAFGNAQLKLISLDEALRQLGKVLEAAQYPTPRDSSISVSGVERYDAVDRDRQDVGH